MQMTSVSHKEGTETSPPSFPHAQDQLLGQLAEPLG